MTLPLIIEILVSNKNSTAFLFCCLFTLLVGISLLLAFKKKERKLNVKDTILITALSLPILVLFSSLPFYFGTEVQDFSEAFFEATSGFTTAGSSIYLNIEELSYGILMWRSMLQWVGGIGIIIFAIAVIPIFNVGSMKLFTQDWSEKPHDLHYRTTELAKLLGIIYVTFTFIIFILLYLSGLSFFDSLCHAMTTIATGGFSTKNESVAYFNNIFAEIIIVIGMLMASLPFTLYLSCIRKNFSIFRDSQVIFFFFIVLFFIISLTYWMYVKNNIDILTALRVSIFNGVSIITGTGYTTENFSSWGSFSNTLLLTMMLIGGCSGSTTGGFKVYRIQVLFLIIVKDLKSTISPRSVTSVNYQNQQLNEDIINSVMIMIFCFIISIFVITGIFSYFGYDFITSISAAITSIAVVGPGLGNIIGPDNGFSQLPSMLKYTLSIGMIIGRLEFLTFLILLLPRFWSK